MGPSLLYGKRAPTRKTALRKSAREEMLELSASWKNANDLGVWLEKKEPELLGDEQVPFYSIFRLGIYHPRDAYAEEQEIWGFDEAEARERLPVRNPRIRLDSGVVVWGAECWWGDEESVQAQLDKASEVVELDPRQVSGLMANS